MATLKEIFEGNTADILEATELLKVLGDRNGQYVWKQLTAEGGDFVAFVTADDENSYPDGGTQDGYWYELVEEGVTLEMLGCTKMAIDEFTSASNMSMGNNIPHSLGTVPKVVFIIGEDILTTDGYSHCLQDARAIVYENGQTSGELHEMAGNKTKYTQNIIKDSSYWGNNNSLCFRVEGSINVVYQAGKKYKVLTMA